MGLEIASSQCCHPVHCPSDHRAFLLFAALFIVELRFLCAAGIINSGKENHSASSASLSSSGHSAAGDLLSGRAFDNGCVCERNNLTGVMDQLQGVRSDCLCSAPQLQPEMEFVNALMNIGVKLGSLDTKEKKSKLYTDSFYLCWKSKVV